MWSSECREVENVSVWREKGEGREERRAQQKQKSQ